MFNPFGHTDRPTRHASKMAHRRESEKQALRMHIAAHAKGRNVAYRALTDPVGHTGRL